jgi:hypothetical protein
VAAAIDGRDLPGVDKILAVARLRENVPSEHTMRLIFRFRCAACSEGNHRERVRQILLAAPLIHEGAIEALRAALVPERRLRNPLLYRRGESPLPEDPEGLRKLFEDADAKKKRRVRFLFARRLNLPVFPDDSARTRLAQIAWAEQYALKAGLE